MTVLAAVPLGLAIGVVVGTLGGGGSVLAVPVLVYGLGENVHAASSASLAVVTAGALGGAVRHAHAGRVCGRHAAFFIGAAAPGIVVGTALGNAVGRHAFAAAFAVIMLLGALGTWRSDRHTRAPTTTRRESMCPPARLRHLLAAAVMLGAMTGFFGVGGGFLILPVLVTFQALSMRLAVGTSLVIIAATSFIALVTHIFVGHAPDVSVTVSMSAACAAGASAGAGLSSRLRPRELRRGFAAIVAAVATYVLLSVAFLGGPAGS
jgi:uncharacterized membrane protein YfcA